MKRFVQGALAAAMLFGAGITVAADQCTFDIAGTWESAPTKDGAAVPARYRFGADGSVITLSRGGASEGGEWRESADAARFFYRLDDARAPSVIEFLGPDNGTRKGSMEISQYDSGAFTTLDANSEPTRWIRVDPERRFLILVASEGEIRTGGPAFAMLIRTDADGHTFTDTFGFYLAGEARIVGAIPEEVRNRFMLESRAPSDTMLRLELTGAEFDRSLAVLRTWNRRARDHEMLYEVPYLNNIVFLEQLAMSLNECGDRIQVHKLGWNVGDRITARYNLPQIPFHYIQDLRRLNESLHLGNEKFRDRMGRACVGTCRALNSRHDENTGFVPASAALPGLPAVR
jgi:hypothetical protein